MSKEEKGSGHGGDWFSSFLALPANVLAAAAALMMILVVLVGLAGTGSDEWIAKNTPTARKAGGSIINVVWSVAVDTLKGTIGTIAPDDWCLVGQGKGCKTAPKPPAATAKTGGDPTTGGATTSGGSALDALPPAQRAQGYAQAAQTTWDNAVIEGDSGAIAYASQALALDPKNTDAMRVLQSTQKLMIAVDAMRNVTANIEDDPQAHLDAANTVLAIKHNLKEALAEKKAAEQAVRDNAYWNSKVLKWSDWTDSVHSKEQTPQEVTENQIASELKGFVVNYKVYGPMVGWLDSAGDAAEITVMSKGGTKTATVWLTRRFVQNHIAKSADGTYTIK